MSRKKNSTALFEVIARDKDRQASEPGIAVPQWMAGQDGASRGQAAAAPAGPPKARSEAAPAGPRLNLSLSYVSCLALALALLVLVGGAFWLGRATAPEKVAFAFEAGSNGGPGSGDTPPAAAPRRSGKYYLVIQMLQGATPADRAEADKIVEFCRSKNLGADVRILQDRPTGKGKYFVWSSRAFDVARSAEGNAFALEIEALGKEYFGRHMTYDFRQRLDGRPSGKLEPYFLKQK